ncbi:MAG TPA: peptidylprolyl isomerase [Burkholderiaceae bacterium]|jgi:FKBP-type peptidyl-prolyl cis-trans isomerase SlyD|nr:peptidylprolyl isomerase [Burkholderiaceae bacterium]HQR78468.1 peptidylprolyl isomerase [Burkholderiaceae bacterium]
MKIAADALVSLEVSMYDAQGQLLDKTEEPLQYLHGHEDIFPRIEEALAGKEVGAHLMLQLEPEDAFGEYDPELVMLTPVNDLGAEVTVGLRVEAAGPDGEDRCIFTITDIAEGMAVLDGNHPLAGIALRFDIRVLDVRQATAQELEEAEAPGVPDFLRLDPKTLH